MERSEIRERTRGWPRISLRSIRATDSIFKHQTHIRDLAAHVARDLLSNFLTLLIRGRRECRAPMRRGAKWARSHHGHTGITRHSPRNGFTVSFVLSPAIGLFCHRHLQDLPQA